MTKDVSTNCRVCGAGALGSPEPGADGGRNHRKAPCRDRRARRVEQAHVAGRRAERFPSRTPVGELKGTIEVYSKKPNKTRTLIKIDATALGGGQIVNDQRFDGATGYVIDSFNGNREITGDQLEAMKAGSFPTPLLNYKDSGVTAGLGNREKVGAAEAYVIQLTPKSGPGVRVFIDAENFMLVKTIITINVPQLGGPIDQVVEFSDFRDVDGFKIPYATKSSNPVQTVTATLTDVKHNTEIDDSSFSKPAGQ